LKIWVDVCPVKNICEGGLGSISETCEFKEVIVFRKPEIGRKAGKLGGRAC